MKLGIFTFNVVECNGQFLPKLTLDGSTPYVYGSFPTKQMALAYGTKKLEELFQDALDQLTKPKYRTKSKEVDAMQWFPTCQESIPSPAYYKGISINPGDWIVDNKVVTNEQFKQLFEAVQ